MRITKQIASDVAIKMLADKQKQIEQAEFNLSLMVENAVSDKIPRKVKDTFAEFPQYFDTRSEIRLGGEGFNYVYVPFLKEMPVGAGNCYTPTPEQAKEMIKALNYLDRKKDERRKALREVEALLYNLRTYANVTAKFPEALPFLPTSTNTAVALNVEDVRKLLK